MRLHLGLCSVLSIVSAVRKGDFRASSQQSHLEEIHGHANQTAACCCCKREVVETGWLFKSKQKTSNCAGDFTKVMYAAPAARGGCPEDIMGPRHFCRKSANPPFCV
mmetsp:Transcript_98557/g.136735  ORF Transcript_98557/g.136735 Transcript_98557/m.136735 type:complete len:107 (-) Transcript_98557:74-394(-)